VVLLVENQIALDQRPKKTGKAAKQRLLWGVGKAAGCRVRWTEGVSTKGNLVKAAAGAVGVKRKALRSTTK
jgi:hypothetical protein